MQRLPRSFSRSFFALVIPALLAATIAATPALAQAPITGIKSPPVQTRSFGELAEGPYNRLVIQNVNVLQDFPKGPTCLEADPLTVGREEWVGVPVQRKRARSS